MSTRLVTYKLVHANRATDTSQSLQKIIDYLLTFVGEIQIKPKAKHSYYISYTDTKLLATIQTKPPLKQIILTCNPQDNLSVNLIKKVTKNIGLRIFNNRTKSFLINDPNLLDLTSAPIDKAISKIFKKHHLAPLFQYHHTLIFYAQDKKNRIHLVNRHLLEYLKDHPGKNATKAEFSQVIAQNIGTFVALSDRGVIPTSFYQLINQPKKIYNLSGLNLNSVYKNIIFRPIYFHYHQDTQAFIQADLPHLPATISLKKGQNLITALHKAKIKNYLTLKIAQDVTYQTKTKTLIPVFSVSVFLNN